MPKGEPDAGLLKHTAVAKLFKITPKTLRAWVKRGVFPEPHITQWVRPDDDAGAILYYREFDIKHRIETGFWPEGTRFRDACRHDSIEIAGAIAARPRVEAPTPQPEPRVVRTGQSRRDAILESGSKLANRVHAMNDRRVTEKMDAAAVARALGEPDVYRVAMLCDIFDYCDAATVRAVLDGTMTTTGAGATGRGPCVRRLRCNAGRQVVRIGGASETWPTRDCTVFAFRGQGR